MSLICDILTARHNLESRKCEFEYFELSVKYEALYLQTIVLRKDNQFFRCLETAVRFFLTLYVELPGTTKDLSYYSGENEEF